MITCRTKQWGNSIGVIIPKEFATEKGIGVNEEVLVEVEKKSKKTVLQELSGSLKFKKPTEQILKESRKELESKYW